VKDAGADAAGEEYFAEDAYDGGRQTSWSNSIVRGVHAERRVAKGKSRRPGIWPPGRAIDMVVAQPDESEARVLRHLPARGAAGFACEIVEASEGKGEGGLRGAGRPRRVHRARIECAKRNSPEGRDEGRIGTRLIGLRWRETSSRKIAPAKREHL